MYFSPKFRALKLWSLYLWSCWLTSYKKTKKQKKTKPSCCTDAQLWTVHHVNTWICFVLYYNLLYLNEPNDLEDWDVFTNHLFEEFEKVQLKTKIHLSFSDLGDIFFLQRKNSKQFVWKGCYTSIALCCTLLLNCPSIQDQKMKHNRFFL